MIHRGPGKGKTMIEPTAATVTVDHIATRPIVPLNSLLKKQSVKGL